jgi:hypothetical protein
MAEEMGDVIDDHIGQQVLSFLRGDALRDSARQFRVIRRI